VGRGADEQLLAVLHADSGPIRPARQSDRVEGQPTALVRAGASRRAARPSPGTRGAGPHLRPIVHRADSTGGGTGRGPPAGRSPGPARPAAPLLRPRPWPSRSCRCPQRPRRPHASARPPAAGPTGASSRADRADPQRIGTLARAGSDWLQELRPAPARPTPAPAASLPRAPAWRRHGRRCQLGPRRPSMARTTMRGSADATAPAEAYGPVAVSLPLMLGAEAAGALVVAVPLALGAGGRFAGRLRDQATVDPEGKVAWWDAADPILGRIVIWRGTTTTRRRTRQVSGTAFPTAPNPRSDASRGGSAERSRPDRISFST